LLYSVILLSSRPGYHRRFYYCFHYAVPRSRSSSSHNGTATAGTACLQTTESALGDAYLLLVVPRSHTCQGGHPFATADAHVFRRLLREPPQSKLLQVVEQ